jgi:hypothetical protein
MRKSLLLFALLVALAAPVASAAPRDDEARGGRDVVSRIVRIVRNIVRAFEEGIVPEPPRP